MADKDLRSFFKSEGNITSTNKSILVKTQNLNPKKDIKPITKKENKKQKQSKPKSKIIEKDENSAFMTPSKKKKTLPNLKKTSINKDKVKQNKKIIVDDEDEGEDEDIQVKGIEEEKKAAKKNNEKKIDLGVIKEKIEHRKPPTPVKKVQQLIPITVEDFFNKKPITKKSDEEIKKQIEKNKEKEKMKIENEEKNMIKEENNIINEEQTDLKEEKNIEEENNIKKEKKVKEEKNILKEKGNNKMEIDDEDMILINEYMKEQETKNNIKQNEDIEMSENQPKTKITTTNNKSFPVILKNKPKTDIKSVNREVKKTYIENSNGFEKNIKTNLNVNNNTSISGLLADKYSPKSLSDIIGNQQNIRNLELWLDNWNNNHLYKNISQKKNNNQFGKRITNNLSRAAIISGPPGIGKTSTVRVLAKVKGYKVFELNASDKRNKDSINQSVGFLMNNTTISWGENKAMTKNIIIMDEVDGMAGNEDKGGIHALIDIVKKTKVPIIFICNDIYSPKLKSLLNYCYDLRFSRPDKRQIVSKLYDICKKENIIADNMTLSNIVECFGNDIRQTINYLDLYSRQKKFDLKNDCFKSQKDKSVSVNAFEICKILLNKAESIKYNFSQKLDLFFVDFDLIPAMIYENYIDTKSINNNNLDKTDSLKKIVEGLDHMSFADNIDEKIRSNMEWGLLPDRGIHGTIIPSMIFSSYLGFPKFPEYFSKLSKLNKFKREISELRKLFPELSFYEIQNSAGPVLYNSIVDKLINNGKNGIDEIVEIFCYYRMNNTLFKENLYDIQTKAHQELYNKTNTVVKTALTKKLNERFLNQKQPKMKTIMMKIEKRDQEGNLIDQEDDDVDEEEMDDQSSSLFEPIRKTNKKKK